MEPTMGINKRAFVSCGLFLSCIGLPLSGFMNRIFDSSNDISQKQIWLSVHIVLAVLFVFFGSIHISFNWKLLLKYLESYSLRIVSKELILASVLIFVLLFAAVFNTFIV